MPALKALCLHHTTQLRLVSGSREPSAACATVHPPAMLLRVLSAQLLVFILS